MAKVDFKDKQSLQDAKDKARGVVSYRKMRDGRIMRRNGPTRINRVSHHRESPH